MAHTGGAAAAAAAANALKASGAIVSMRPSEFLKILRRGSGETVVVIAQGGIFSKNYQYLTSYKGLFFFTKSDEQLSLPSKTEVITANKIWIPG